MLSTPSCVFPSTVYPYLFVVRVIETTGPVS
jgi:hypothetical protein